jgi:hypothetical protein
VTEVVGIQDDSHSGTIEQRVARTIEEIQTVASAWDALGISYVDADLEYFLALVQHRAEILRPHVIVLEQNGTPQALVVGRVERMRFPVRLGYKAVYRPQLRALLISHGGMSGVENRPTAEAVVDALDAAFGAREVDVVVLPAVRMGSELEQAVLTEVRDCPCPRRRRPTAV